MLGNNIVKATIMFIYISFGFFSTGLHENICRMQCHNTIIYFFYCSNDSASNVTGTSFSVGVFSHKMKMDDALLGIISCASKILSGLVYAFAVTDWQVYMGNMLTTLL